MLFLTPNQQCQSTEGVFLHVVIVLLVFVVSYYCSVICRCSVHRMTVTLLGVMYIVS